MDSVGTGRPLTIIGAGGHAKVVAGTATACGHELAGFVDDDPATWTSTLFGVAVAGPLDIMLRRVVGPAVMGIGDNDARLQISRRFPSLEWVTLVHPTSWAHDSVALGSGTVVFAGVVVQPDARIGTHVILNTASSVDHDCAISDYVHLAPGVHLAGHVRVETGAFLGIGAVVIPRVTIGEWAVVGAGAVVTRDVPPRTTVVGAPAMAVRG